MLRNMELASGILVDEMHWMKKIPLSPTLFGVFACSAPIILGPFYTAAGYSVLAHTSSDLGAQHTPFNWLMNIGFLLMGLGVAYDARQHWYKAPLVAILFVIFGVAMALTGVFSLRPIDEGLSFDETSHALHSVFATITGFAYTAGAVTCGFVEKEQPRKLWCFVAAVLATILSAAMAFLPGYEGLLQRVMFAVTFSWIAVFIPVSPRK